MPQPINQIGPGGIETFICTYCNECKTEDQFVLMYHMEFNHSEKVNGVCPICVARGGRPNYNSVDLFGHF